MDEITLHPWAEDDLPVLQRSNTPEMTAFLGGPESPEKLVARHAKFLRLWASEEARMFTVHSSISPQPVGSVGYWKTDHHGTPVYEAGWSIETAFQGRGIARAALRACIDDAAAQHERDRLLAFPRIDNTASNALCRAVGMTWTAEENFEYPPGTPIRVNTWAVDLRKWRAAERQSISG